MYPRLEGPSHLILYVLCSPKNLRLAKRTLLDVVKIIKNYDLGPDDLENVKRKVIGRYLLEREPNNGIAFNYGLWEALGQGYEGDVNFQRRIMHITAREIRAAANKYLDNATILVIKPASDYDMMDMF